MSKNNNAQNPANRRGTKYTIQGGYDPQTGLATESRYNADPVNLHPAEVEHGNPDYDKAPHRTRHDDKKLRRQRIRAPKHGHKKRTAEKEANLGVVIDTPDWEFEHDVVFEFKKTKEPIPYWERDGLFSDDTRERVLYTCDMKRFKIVVSLVKKMEWVRGKTRYTNEEWLGAFLDGENVLLEASGNTAKMALAKLFGLRGWFVAGATNINPETLSTYRRFSLYDMYGQKNIHWVGMGGKNRAPAKPKYKNHIPRPVKGKMVWQFGKVGLPLSYKCGENLSPKGKDRRFEPKPEHVGMNTVVGKNENPFK